MTSSKIYSAVIIAIDKGGRKMKVWDCDYSWRQFLFLVRFFFAVKEKNEQNQS